MTDKAAKPRAKKSAKEKASTSRSTKGSPKPKDVIQVGSSQSPSQVVVPCQTTPLPSDSDLDEDAVVTIRRQYNLPMLYQPSNGSVFDHAFISHFVDLNRGMRTYDSEIPWLTRLPGMHSDADNAALRLSLRATSMAFYAKLHQDVSVLIDSYRWYTKSLGTLRMLLNKMSNDATPNDEEVLVPVVLGLYEVYAGTTPNSVFQHLTAAIRILQMRGPENCTSGVPNSLLRALRVSDAHLSIIYNRPSIFSHPDWMTIPFGAVKKNAHQELVDVLLRIPQCLALCRQNCSLADFFSRRLPATIDHAAVRQRATELFDSLSDWAGKHPHLCSAQVNSHVTLEDMTTPIDRSNSLTPRSGSMTLMLPDSFVALTAAVYKSAYLILTLLLYKISPEASYDHYGIPNSPGSSLMTRAKKDATDIIDISTYIDSSHPIGFDFMRSVFPLVVVAIVGPTKDEQSNARKLLERWRDVRSIGGLASTWVKT